MTATPKTYYKNNGKLRWTKGRFIGLSEPTGVFGFIYAGYEKPSGDILWIPKHLVKGPVNPTKEAQP